MFRVSFIIIHRCRKQCDIATSLITRNDLTDKPDFVRSRLASPHVFKETKQSYCLTRKLYFQFYQYFLKEIHTITIGENVTGRCLKFVHLHVDLFCYNLIIASKHRTYVHLLQGSTFPLAKYSQFIVYVFYARILQRNNISAIEKKSCLSLNTSIHRWVTIFLPSRGTVLGKR